MSNDNFKHEWTPAMEIEHQREKETHGPDPRELYKQSALTQKMSPEELQKCVDSVYWKGLSSASRAFVAYVYKDFEEFKKYLPAMGIKI